MTSIKDTAAAFFEACETGKGWAACAEYCHPDADYELRSFAVDEDRRTVLGFAVFKGTHTGEGGPVPPTGKRAETDYVYAMEFDGDRIRRMTKIWNDVWAMRQLGWSA